MRRFADQTRVLHRPVLKQLLSRRQRQALTSTYRPEDGQNSAGPKSQARRTRLRKYQVCCITPRPAEMHTFTKTNTRKRLPDVVFSDQLAHTSRTLLTKKGTLLAHSLADDKRRRKTTDGKNALQHDIKERQQTMHNAVDAPFRCLIIVRSPVQVRASPPEKTPSQAGFLSSYGYGFCFSPLSAHFWHRSLFSVGTGSASRSSWHAAPPSGWWQSQSTGRVAGCPNGPLRERMGTGPERDARIPVACPCRTVEPCPSRTVSPTFC